MQTIPLKHIQLTNNINSLLCHTVQLDRIAIAYEAGLITDVAYEVPGLVGSLASNVKFKIYGEDRWRCADKNLSFDVVDFDGRIRQAMINKYPGAEIHVSKSRGKKDATTYSVVIPGVCQSGWSYSQRDCMYDAALIAAGIKCGLDEVVRATEYLWFLCRLQPALKGPYEAPTKYKFDKLKEVYNNLSVLYKKFLSSISQVDLDTYVHPEFTMGSALVKVGHRGNTTEQRKAYELVYNTRGEWLDKAYNRSRKHTNIKQMRRDYDEKRTQEFLTEEEKAWIAEQKARMEAEEAKYSKLTHTYSSSVETWDQILGRPRGFTSVQYIVSDQPAEAPAVPVSLDDLAAQIETLTFQEGEHP